MGLEQSGYRPIAKEMPRFIIEVYAQAEHKRRDKMWASFADLVQEEITN